MLSVVRDENAQKKTPACWLCCERFINKTGENKVVSDEDFESMACWLCWHFLKKRRQKRLMRADKKACASRTNKQAMEINILILMKNP